jgi:hypothetical protein
MPSADELESKPERVPYPQSSIKYGHYGKMVQRMIDQCVALEDGEKKEAYTTLIANLMKKQFLTWNRDTVPDPVILKDLAELSKGKLRMKPEVQLAATADLLRAQQNGPRNEVDLRRRPSSGGGGGGGNKKRNRNRKKRY